MEKRDDMPIWVFLAFSSIETRKGALILIWSSVIFTFYCIPWALFFQHDWVNTLFLIDDWSWIAMMLPINIWYILSFRWVDKNGTWKQ